jgi:hypothetical protein
LQVIEANAAAQQLANDERRPSLCQDFGRKGDRTELAISSLLDHVRSSHAQQDRFTY